MSATTVAAPDAQVLEEAPAARRRGKLLVVLTVAILLGGAAAWWFLLAPSGDDEGGEVVEGAIVTLEPMTTTTGAAGIHHARVGIALVLTEDGSEADIPPKIALMQDALLQAVAERDADTLRSADGSDALRVELTEAAQTIWSPDDVARVVLTELLVQ